MPRASSEWKVAGKVTYGKSTIKADFSFLFLCVQLKKLKTKS